MSKAKKAKTKVTKEDDTPKGTHGGRREGSGKHSNFPGKANATTFAFSTRADKKFRDKAEALSVSFGDLIEAMFWKVGREFRDTDIAAAIENYKRAGR